MPVGQTFDEFMNEELERDPEFARVAAEHESEYALIDALVGARAAAGFTQSALAKRMGVKPSVISRFESGEDSLRFKTIQRYANATGQTISIVVKPVQYPAEAAPQSVSKAS